MSEINEESHWLRKVEANLEKFKKNYGHIISIHDRCFSKAYNFYHEVNRELIERRRIELKDYFDELNKISGFVASDEDYFSFGPGSHSIYTFVYGTPCNSKEQNDRNSKEQNDRNSKAQKNLSSKAQKNLSSKQLDRSNRFRGTRVSRATRFLR